MGRPIVSSASQAEAKLHLGIMLPICDSARGTPSSSANVPALQCLACAVVHHKTLIQAIIREGLQFDSSVYLCLDELGLDLAYWFQVAHCSREVGRMKRNNNDNNFHVHE